MLPLITALALSAPVNPFEEPDESALFALDEKLVTVASRYAQTVDKAPGIISVYTADDIRDYGFRTVSDALRSLPGIYIWDSLEGRDLAAIRGTISADNNKVLLLIDGMPFYDGVYNHAFLDEYLPISHIAQIEIIKGPGSVIYGSNAFSGVISIRTFTASELDGMRARWTVSSPFRTDLTVSAGGRDRLGDLDVKLAVYARLFDTLGDGLDITPRGRGDATGSDPKRSLNLGGQLEVGDLRVHLLHTDYRHVFLPSEVTNPTEAAGKDLDQFGLWYHNTGIDLRYDLHLTRDAVLTPFFYSQYHDNPGAYFFGADEWVADPLTGEVQWQVTTVETEKQTRRLGAGVDLDLRLGLDHRVLGGVGVETVKVIEVADLYYEDGETTPRRDAFQAPQNSRIVTPYGFTQYTWTALPELEFVAGLRLHQPTRWNTEAWTATTLQLSPRAALLYVPNDTVTAKLLYGQAFRAANARELFILYPEGETPRFAESNDALSPEKIETLEVEISLAPPGPLSVRIDGFGSLLRNEIDKASDPNQYQNNATTLRVAGGELEARLTLDRLQVEASYALTLARYASHGTGFYRGQEQFEFPPHMAKGSTRVQLTDQFTAAALGEIYGARPREVWSPDSGLTNGAAFGLIHLEVRASELGENGRFDVTVGARNLTDHVWGTGVYRDDVNQTNGDGTARYPNEYEGEGRSVHLGVEVAL